jgi:hypothetical protein
MSSTAGVRTGIKLPSAATVFAATTVFVFRAAQA